MKTRKAIAMMMPGCKIEGCNGVSWQRGWCSKHYTRWHRHGDPLGGRKTMNGEPERYYLEVVLTFDGAECLMWPFTKASNGYGQMRIDGTLHNVHRLVCEVVNGPAPVGNEAAHSCGKRLCCNHRHLSWKTPAGNWADRYAHGTHQNGECNHSAKLTDQDVKSVRELLNGGLSQRAIAAQFGISQSTISLIANGHLRAARAA